MAIRFYVDADIIGLGKLLVQVRTDVTYAGDRGGIGIDRKTRPASPVNPQEPDPDWISTVAGRGWIVLTRDRHMLSRPAERGEILGSAARHIRLDPSKKQLTKWDQLEIVMCQWRSIEARLEEPGPWVYAATRTRLRKEL
jgi:uncharacterized protein with PIN domain